MLLNKPRPLIGSLSLVLCAAGLVVRGQDQLGEQEERAIRAAIETVAPTVVRVEALGGLEKVGQVLLGEGPTTGLIVSADGYVISSAFNFLQQPASILVTLPGGKRAPAKIVARDHSRMLVLLKVATDSPLPVPIPTPRDEMIVGQWTIALGRTFEQSDPSVSVGILSATNRVWGKAIQTDCKISPINYGGPLVDIRGRVLGVLAPLSPQATEEIAGAEWYDSGIGFAVPLVDIVPRLERMKQGTDLYPGLLGVSFKSVDPLADETVIATCKAKSPAALAGLKSGDRIVEFDGAPIERMAQLKHAMGRRYASEKAHVVVRRGDERLERDIELAEKLDPYQHPFLGMLPMRGGADTGGVMVRYVYPDSGAAKGGMQPGDLLVSLEGEPIANAEALRDKLAEFDPGRKVVVLIRRAQQELRLEIESTMIPSAIPAKLPAARATAVAAPDQRPAVGIVPIKLPEDDHECVAYIPENYRGDVPYGLVVWLHEPGGFDQEKIVATWKALCEQNDLIVVAPRAADSKKWQATELPFIRNAMEEVMNQYRIDRTRIVTHGYQAGGAMAFLAAFNHRDLIRGVAAVDSPLPQRLQLPDNEPLQRLAIFTSFSTKSKLAKPLEANAKRFGEMKYPVTIQSLPDARPLNGDELMEMVRWLDTLDRI